MDGVAGFEPARGRIKTSCLTAWLHPINFLECAVEMPRLDSNQYLMDQNHTCYQLHHGAPQRRTLWMRANLTLLSLCLEGQKGASIDHGGIYIKEYFGAQQLFSVAVEAHEVDPRFRISMEYSE